MELVNEDYLMDNGLNLAKNLDLDNHEIEIGITLRMV